MTLLSELSKQLGTDTCTTLLRSSFSFSSPTESADVFTPLWVPDHSSPKPPALCWWLQLVSSNLICGFHSCFSASWTCTTGLGLWSQFPVEHLPHCYSEDVPRPVTFSGNVYTSSLPFLWLPYHSTNNQHRTLISLSPIRLNPYLIPTPITIIFLLILRQGFT